MLEDRLVLCLQPRLGTTPQIAELVINLAQLLGLHVTAEGVERAQQCEFLLRMGCTRGQGWLYAKAMPLAQLLALSNPLPGLEQMIQAPLELQASRSP